MIAPASPNPAERDARPRILVIRRDNIGDLVCTTPLIAALRERYPGGHIAALVNTYNEAVLAGNPAVDAVHAYEKGKHRGEARSAVSVYVDRLRLILALRSLVLLRENSRGRQDNCRKHDQVKAPEPAQD